ncbi:hypothetical protein DmGdi_32680 [Gluconobacter sp. Gdi]|nr:hypothetical protein DmGdi_32680 [Gluconobacter sp. Gdi]
MGSPRVIRAIGRDTGNVLIFRDLFQKRRQNRCITGLVSRHFNSPDFQRSFVDPDMKFTPDTTFRTAVLTSVPFTFSLDLDPGAVDQEMQGAVRTAIRNIDCQGFLPADQRAEIRHRPRKWRVRKTLWY